MKQLYERKMDFGVLEISLEGTSFLEEQGLDANETLRKFWQQQEAMCWRLKTSI